MYSLPHPPLPPVGMDLPGCSSIPVGAITAFAGAVGGPISSPPDPASQAPSDATHRTSPVEAWGWMVCDGRTLDVAAYPELYAVLGDLYGGEGDTFRIPDLRGQFLRGVATTTSQDPGLSVRTDAAGHGTKSATVGSHQLDALQTHTHRYEAFQAAVTGSPPTAGGKPQAEPVETSPPVKPARIDAETRARNVYVYFLIKFTYAADAAGRVGNGWVWR